MVWRTYNMNVLFEKAMSTLHESKLLLTKPNPKEIDHINFAITYICNSRCKHCNIWMKYKEDPKAVQKELKLQQIKETFDRSQYLENLKTISLTGGEPFLRNDFVDICGFFIHRYPKAKIVIPTNAVNINLVITKLEEIVKTYNPKNIYISISLDGIGVTHDEIRGVPGDYNRVLELIELIKKSFPAINQGISFTITKHNYKDLLSIYEFTKEMSIGFGFQFAQNSSSFYENLDKCFEWKDSKLDEVNEIIRVLCKKIKAEQNILQNITSTNLYYISHMVDFQRNPCVISSCYSGFHSLFMDAYGNIYPCIMLNKKLGNICDLDFDDIWSSKMAKETREFIRSNKCACWTPCETFPSLARNPKIIFWNICKLIGM